MKWHGYLTNESHFGGLPKWSYIKAIDDVPGSNPSTKYSHIIQSNKLSGQNDNHHKNQNQNYLLLKIAQPLSSASPRERERENGREGSPLFSGPTSILIILPFYPSRTPTPPTSLLPLPPPPSPPSPPSSSSPHHSLTLPILPWDPLGRNFRELSP